MSIKNIILWTLLGLLIGGTTIHFVEKSCPPLRSPLSSTGSAPTSGPDYLLLPGVRKVYFLKDMLGSGEFDLFIAENYKEGSPPILLTSSQDLGMETVSLILSSSNISEVKTAPPMLVSMTGFILTNEHDTPLYLINFRLNGDIVSIYSADMHTCKTDNGEGKIFYTSVMKLCDVCNPKATEYFVNLAHKIAPDYTKSNLETLRKLKGLVDDSTGSIDEALRKLSNK